jgi:uncharacterized RDD family membrane protein YckC
MADNLRLRENYIFMSTIRIQTTQNVALEYEVASLGDRLLAALIDYLIYTAWYVGCIVFMASMNEVGVLMGVVIILPMVFYHLVCEIFLNGQSIGKHVRDLKVLKLDGRPATLSDYLLRWVFRPIDILLSFGVVAMVSIAASGKSQRIGDIAAGTTVVRLKRKQQARPLVPPYDEQYTVVFPEVGVLSDKDVALIRKLFRKSRQYQNEALQEKLAARIKSVTGIVSDLPEEEFIRTVLKDHHHLMALL